MNTSPRADLPERGGVVLIDGDCVVCRRAQGWVMRRAPDAGFRFEALASDAGRRWLVSCGLDPEDRGSMVVVCRDGCWRASDAVLQVAAGLPWPWRALRVFRLIPRALRDPAYAWFARHRHRFGRASG